MSFWIVLETMWAYEDDYHPYVATDTQGRVMKFNTAAKARKYAKKLQKGLVVEIPD